VSAASARLVVAAGEDGAAVPKAVRHLCIVCGLGEHEYVVNQTEQYFECQNGKMTADGSYLPAPAADTCSRCGRDSHFWSNCYATWHLDGTLLDRSTIGHFQNVVWAGPPETKWSHEKRLREKRWPKRW